MMPGPTFVALVEDYLALRRRLGFGLVTQGRMLLAFARHAGRVAPDGPLTVELAVQWATTSCRSRDPSAAARRLDVVRGFTRHRALFDPTTEVPPLGLLGPRYRRKPPHVYSADEIAALLRAAAELRPRGGLRPRTFVTLFGLLAATGLRVSEARRLTCCDVDLVAGVVTVREGKFRKSRLVPLHPSAVAALRRYEADRDRRAAPRSESFFRTERLAVLSRMAVQMTFAKLRRRLGWTAEGRARLPRIQDLRHAFVVRRLQRWYEQGADVDRRMAHLATYLGHAKVTDTYWYLTAVPELMALTARRFERFAREQEGAS